TRSPMHFTPRRFTSRRAAARSRTRERSLLAVVTRHAARALPRERAELVLAHAALVDLHAVERAVEPTVRDALATQVPDREPARTARCRSHRRRVAIPLVIGRRAPARRA